MRSILVLLILVMIGLNGKGQSVTALPDSVLSQCCLEVTLLNGNVTTVDWVFIQYITRDGTGTKLFVEYAPNFGGIQWETQIRIQDDFDEVIERSKFIILPFTVGSTDYGIHRNWIANIEENTTTGGTWIYGRFGTPTKRKFSAVEDYPTLKALLLACRPRAIVVAENGLYTEGDTVRMGGILIEDTRIETDTFDFEMIDTLTSTAFGIDHHGVYGDTTFYAGRRWGAWRNLMSIGRDYWFHEMKDTVSSDKTHILSGLDAFGVPSFDVVTSNGSGTKRAQFQQYRDNGFWIMKDSDTNPNYTQSFFISPTSVGLGNSESSGGEPGNGVSVIAYGSGTNDEFIGITTRGVDNSTATVGQYLQLQDAITGKVEYATIDLSGYLEFGDTVSLIATKYYAKTLPTTIASGYLATSNGTNLVARNLFDDNVAVSILNSKPLVFPTWTTAGRPSSTNNYRGRNTTTGFDEGYFTSQWENYITSTGATALQVPYFSSAGQIAGNTRHTVNASTGAQTITFNNTSSSVDYLFAANNSIGTFGLRYYNNNQAEFGLIGGARLWFTGSGSQGELRGTWRIVGNTHYQSPVNLAGSAPNSNDVRLVVSKSGDGANQYIYMYTQRYAVNDDAPSLMTAATHHIWGTRRSTTTWNVSIDSSRMHLAQNGDLRLYSAAGFSFGATQARLNIVGRGTATTYPLLLLENLGGTDRFGVLENGKVSIAKSAPDYIFDVTSTDAYGLPRGTVAQRPTIVASTTPFRYTTDSTALEYGESVGVWQQLATRAYVRSLVSALPTTNIYTANGTLTSNRTLTGGAFDLTLNTDVIVGDSLDITSTPAHAAITGILTRDATGWVGLTTLGTGLTYSGGVLTGQNIYNSDGTIPSGTDRRITLAGGAGSKVVFYNDPSYMGFEFSSISAQGNIRSFDEVYSRTASKSWQVYSNSGDNPVGYLAYSNKSNTKNDAFTLLNTQRGIDQQSGVVGIVLDSTNKDVVMGLWGSIDSLSSVSASKKTFFTGYGYGRINGADKRFRLDNRSWAVQSLYYPALNDLRAFNWLQIRNIETDTTSNSLWIYEKYAFPNSTPSTTSGVKQALVWTGTGSSATPAFETITTSTSETKRDTIIYVTDVDYDFSAAITTAQINTRYNRIIIFMTCSTSAADHNTLTMHTPDSNLNQCEIVVYSIDDNVLYRNDITFGASNLLSPTGTLNTTYNLSGGQWLHVRVADRSGYKYFISY